MIILFIKRVEFHRSVVRDIFKTITHHSKYKLPEVWQLLEYQQTFTCSMSTMETLKGKICSKLTIKTPE